MFVIIGAVVVIGCVIAGYLMEHGNLSVLFQPAELVIIFGSAIGSLIISASPGAMKLVIKSLSGIFKPGMADKAKYLELLTMLYNLFSKIRKEGLISVESDIENPASSPLFSKYTNILSNHHVMEFICDNLKVVIATNIPAHELENIMDLEIETHHHEAVIPAHLISKVGDALPGLGIVAAVLGVVLAMSKIDQPPAIIGQSIAAALVGTFLGVLMCYGFVGPLATNIESKAKEEEAFYHVIKVAIVSFVRGSAPQMAVEFARRGIPVSERPNFEELEKEVRGKK